MPGEALESWLGAVAQRLDTWWGDLLTAVAPPTKPLCLHRPDLTVYLNPDEAAAIAAATDTWQATVEALTLSRYDGHLLTIDGVTGCLQSPWTPNRFPKRSPKRSRFCPLCLRASGGRWQLSWRLPWVFTCEEHSCTLADTCPQCGQFQSVRPRWLSMHEVPQLGQCGMNAKHGGEPQRCHGNLLEAVTTTLRPHHPLARTQTRLSQVLATKLITFGVYGEAPTSSLQVLRDLHMLAARILSMARAEDVHDLLGPRQLDSITESLAEVDPSSRSFPTSFAARASALTTGLGIELALNVVGCATIEDASARLRPIFKSGQASGRIVKPSALRFGGVSPVMHAVQLKALANSLAPNEQLRYRTAAAFPCYPRQFTEAVLRGIPTCLWRDWSFRLTVGNHPLRLMRPLLSLLLLSTGRQLSMPTAARRLGSRPMDPTSWHILASLHGHPLWTNVSVALIRLADYLSEHPSPIDYQRRRQLDYRGLLPPERWTQICDENDLGRRPRAQTGELARSWLFERISMQPVSRSPFAADIPRAARLRSKVVAMFTSEVIEELDDAGARFLEQHNVFGEPVTWSPPQSIIADLVLPGPNPAAISIAELHEAVTDTSASMTEVASRFGVSIAVLRYLLESSPPPRPTRTWIRDQTQFEYAQSQLPESELIRLHVQDRLPIKVIATRIGVQPQAVSDLARKYEIQVRSSRFRLPDERDWIYREYVEKQRPITDMAQQLGVDISTLYRRAKIYGIAMCHDPHRRRGPRNVAADDKP